MHFQIHYNITITQTLDFRQQVDCVYNHHYHHHHQGYWTQEILLDLGYIQIGALELKLFFVVKPNRRVLTLIYKVMPRPKLI